MRKNVIAWFSTFLFAFLMQIVIATFMLYAVIELSIEIAGTLTILILLAFQGYAINNLLRFYFMAINARELVMETVFSKK